tara:strand:+ start:2616 stop:3338 length:723 start_codon:yes stop_codon:yes gene_type:complete
MNKGFQVKHKEIMGNHAVEDRWSEGLVNDEIHKGVWICAPEGTPPDPHIHPDFNEWWVALDGKTRWQIGQYEPAVAQWGDLIMAPAGFSHDIRPWDGKTCVRFGVSKPGGNHDIKGIEPCRFIPIETNFNTPNLIHTKFNVIKNNYDNSKNWTHKAIDDERNTGTYIHLSPKKEIEIKEEAYINAWFILLEGKVDSYDENNKLLYSSNKGDLVYLPRKNTSKILNVTDSSSYIILIRAKN